ncbi:MAG: HAMP domain-containing protein [Geobacter sp.]|jgi:signal transduction histidine kinase|nr:HAMP domain-containing protein [Geobacter sp.]
MKLNAKLILIMLSLLVLAVITLFSLNQFSQMALVQEIQDSSQEISKAVQISIADLTSEAETSRLTGFFDGARQKGINEINIINSDGEIIDSTNPDKIGKIKDVKKLETGVKTAPRKAEGASILSQRPYDVVVPVIVGDEHLGYVQVNMLLDNIQNIQRSNFIKRLVATAMVFTVGIAFTIYLARRYTAPIHRLAEDFKKVSAGDLTVTFPVESKDEIGELAAAFNEMVEKLREREALEKRLYEAEHLSRVGQLASGIAHEIRNPLNYISLAIDHLRAEMNANCPERSAQMTDVADKIREEVRRANYMVVNFMNYGRPLKVRKSQVDYRDLLERTLPVVQAKLTEQGAVVETQIEANLPPLWLDPELMRNCITNFLTNGAQAMPAGGTITLGAVMDPERDGWATLTFADQGVGIAEDDLEKIFQPYFTTKDLGIGLGLAITERIIKAHGGEITVASSPGNGTVFTVRLPMEEGRG